MSSLKRKWEPPSSGKELIVEYYDCDGIDWVMSTLKTALCAGATTSKQDRGRAKFLQDWMEVLLSELGPPMVAPPCLKSCTGESTFMVRALKCTYSVRNDARRFALGKKGPKWLKGGANTGEASSVCMQGCSKALRSALCGRFAMDVDAVNCHPTLLLGMARMLGAREDTLVHMASYVNDRDAWFHDIAATHSIDLSLAKEKAKSLINRIYYGGFYETWMRGEGYNSKYEPRCQRVVDIASEIKALRSFIFNHPEYVEFVAKYRYRLRRETDKNEDAIDRSIWSRIAQGLEDKMLRIIQDVLTGRGWTVLSLMFDGAIVAHRPGHDLKAALRLAESEITKQTHWDVKLLEKPLLGLHREKLTLKLE